MLQSRPKMLYSRGFQEVYVKWLEQNYAGITREMDSRGFIQAIVKQDEENAKRVTAVKRKMDIEQEGQVKKAKNEPKKRARKSTLERFSPKRRKYIRKSSIGTSRPQVTTDQKSSMVTPKATSGSTDTPIPKVSTTQKSPKVTLRATRRHSAGNQSIGTPNPLATTAQKSPLVTPKATRRHSIKNQSIISPNPKVTTTEKSPLVTKRASRGSTETPNLKVSSMVTPGAAKRHSVENQSISTPSPKVATTEKSQDVPKSPPVNNNRPSEVIYNCSFCSDTFENLADFTAHLANKHNIHVDLPKKKEDDAKNNNEVKKKKVKKTDETREMKKPFPCHLCEFRSKREALRNKHLDKIHGVKL